ncbi:zinc ABC transporter substrate-binding protein AztC [Nonomuraea sp. NPDC050691]|uniref:zinc ABC transporter substrate-binding protein AztC n=1 Tax=Nonomuraea sp. NPDC050691 TaxID=3155661 RepID=UPI0033D257C2
MRAIVAVLVLLLAGCGVATGRGPGVVVTTDILGDVTRRVVGDQAEVTVLMRAGADPHSFGVSARQAALVERAELVVHNGLGLEEGVLRHVEAAREAGVPTLAAGDAAAPLPYAGGDRAGQPDPHVWTDPRRVIRIVDAVAARVVAEVDGVDAAKVRANAAAYRAELEALDAWIERRLAPVPAGRRALVTDHHVFGYFAARYGFRVVGAVVPSGTALASPSASDLASLAGAIRAARVPAIFTGVSQPDRLARVLASETGIGVRVVALRTESLGPPGQDAATYTGLMRANAGAVADALTPR